MHLEMSLIWCKYLLIGADLHLSTWECKLALVFIKGPGGSYGGAILKILFINAYFQYTLQLVRLRWNQGCRFDGTTATIESD